MKVWLALVSGEWSMVNALTGSSLTKDYKKNTGYNSYANTGGKMPMDMPGIKDTINSDQ